MSFLGPAYNVFLFMFLFITYRQFHYYAHLYFFYADQNTQLLSVAETNKKKYLCSDWPHFLDYICQKTNIFKHKKKIGGDGLVWRKEETCIKQNYIILIRINIG